MFRASNSFTPSICTPGTLGRGVTKRNCFPLKPKSLFQHDVDGVTGARAVSLDAAQLSEREWSCGPTEDGSCCLFCHGQVGCMLQNLQTEVGCRHGGPHRPCHFHPVRATGLHPKRCGPSSGRKDRSWTKLGREVVRPPHGSSIRSNKE